MPLEDLPTLREKVIVQNSLLCLLKGIQGRITVVELRNESEVCGRIDYVDAFMNTNMSNVVFSDPFGKETKMDVFYVRGKNIRYVQIPDDVNILQTIKQTLDGPGRQMRLRNKPKETVVMDKRSDHPYGPAQNKLRQSKEAAQKRGQAYLAELLEKKRIAKLTEKTEKEKSTPATESAKTDDV
ncbi:U7 snRNA-associated Sm-like protein LSm10 [Tubulanus polymorphus]|uniref:U7 snRNA-associated Sm-like protein LSm10 n=1 Tax=Tubulanus polymorphus TaxID=672921 RepID=UPI003DA2AFBD